MWYYDHMSGVGHESRQDCSGLPKTEDVLVLCQAMILVRCIMGVKKTALAVHAPADPPPAHVQPSLLS